MTLLLFILILSILVLVHEFGHFIIAKLNGIKVEEFGIGFPPRLFAMKYGETNYSVNAVLFGGFVRLYGEQEDVAPERLKDPDSTRKFRAKPVGVQAGVVIAGVVMNFLLAVVLFSILYSIVGIPRKTQIVRIVGVSPNSPARQAGITTEVIVLSIDGTRVVSSKQFIQLVDQRKGKEVTLAVKGKGEEAATTVLVTPRGDPPPGEGPLGVVVDDSEQYFPPWWQRPLWGTLYGLQEAFAWGQQTVFGLATMFATMITQGKVPQGIAGPVGIFHLTGTVSQQGTLAVLQFLGILSINLAILNILPIPPLDGGRLLFISIDWLFQGRARLIRLKLENVLIALGIAFFIVFFVAVTLQDIRRLLGQ